MNIIAANPTKLRKKEITLRRRYEKKCSDLRSKVKRNIHRQSEIVARGAVALQYFQSMERKNDWLNIQQITFINKPKIAKKIDGDLVGRIDAGSFREKTSYYLEPIVSLK